MQFVSIFCNGWVVAVLFSPYEFPVAASTLNCKSSALHSGRGEEGSANAKNRCTDHNGGRDDFRDYFLVAYS